MKEGVYAMNVGPSFESVAECRMLMTWGADVIGECTTDSLIVNTYL